jgi:hypothetical protein
MGAEQYHGTWWVAEARDKLEGLRLGGCILLELAVGATLAAGTSAGVIFGGRALLDQGDGQAHASVAVQPVVQPVVQGVAPAAPLAAPESRLEPTPVEKRGTPWSGTFEGRPDEELLGPLRNGRIRKVKYNRGGSSISLRIEFEDGARAAFKPDQTNLQTIPRKEVAAYRLSRLIGLGAVPPAAPRAFTKEDLIRRSSRDRARSSRGCIAR